MSLKEKLVRAVGANIPYFDRELDTSGTPASVLIYLSLDEHVLLTKRTETVESHKGQIAFPGGRKDPEDLDSRATALREANEEVGLSPSAIEVVGELPLFPLHASNHLVHPVVALGNAKHFEIELTPQASEIAEIFWVPLSFFIEENYYKTEQRFFRGEPFTSHVYRWNDHEIWGATAIMLKNFSDRIKRVSNS